MDDLSEGQASDVPSSQSASTGRVLFVNRFFYPDHSATSQLLSDLAFDLVEEGFPVLVIASRQRYSDPSAGLPKNTNERGVYVHRVCSTSFGRHSTVGRGVDYLTFYLSSVVKLMQLVRSGDVVVAKTDPPLVGIFAAVVARLKKARLVNWLQDVYPEVAQALGVRILVPPLGAILRKLRNWSLREAEKNVVLGNIMAERLTKQNVPPETIAVLPNWADDQNIQPIATVESSLRHKWALTDKFVVGYSGNLGRSHDLGTAIDAAARMVTDSWLEFVFIGGGTGYSAVQSEAAERGLSNCSFKPYQPRDRLSDSLSVPDVHLVSLLPELEGLIVPSKTYGILAAGRPILFIGSPEGEIGRLVVSEKLGFVIEKGDAAGLAERITWLHDHPEELTKMGKRARKLSDLRFSRQKSLDEWSRLLQSALR